jgi:hypothetical protein
VRRKLYSLWHNQSLYRRTWYDFLAEADARIFAVRLGMGEEWEEAWRKGTAMTLEEAVSYALEVEEEASG